VNKLTRFLEGAKYSAPNTVSSEPITKIFPAVILVNPCWTRWNVEGPFSGTAKLMPFCHSCQFKTAGKLTRLCEGTKEPFTLANWTCSEPIPETLPAVIPIDSVWR
jgi:hypothetical protein